MKRMAGFYQNRIKTATLKFFLMIISERKNKKNKFFTLLCLSFSKKLS